MDVITDNQLNTAVFKEVFQNLVWTKLPRVLGPNHTEFFYSGIYSDELKEIKVLLRSSLAMSVTESFKNRMPQNGAIPADSYKGPLVDWGSYVEVRVPQSLYDEAAALAKPLPKKQTQKIEW